MHVYKTSFNCFNVFNYEVPKPLAASWQQIQQMSLFMWML